MLTGSDADAAAGTGLAAANGRRSHDERHPIEHLLPDGFLADSLRADARAGLTATPKSLPPKWFYDERGSELFEEITRLRRVLPDPGRAGDPARARPARSPRRPGPATLVELGSGSADKTRLLLDALRAAGTLRSYVPVDVSESALRRRGAGLLASYPGLRACTRWSRDFERAPRPARRGGRRLVAFLGGTIGNLVPGERAAFLASVRAPAVRRATRCCSAPTWSRTRRCWSPPTTTPPG